jgi:hypothetical protein
MALSVFPWKNRGEAEPTKLNRQNLNAAEEALGAQVTSGAIPLPASVVIRRALAEEGSALGILALYPEDFAAELGIKPGEDYTRAFQALIDYTVTNKIPRAEVRLGATYNIRTAPRTDRQGNSIVALPIYGGINQRLWFRGAPGKTHFNVEPPAETTYSAEHGPPSFLGGPTTEQLGVNTHFSATVVEMTDVRIYLPSNPSIAGVNLSRMVGVGKMDVEIFGQGYAEVEPTHPTAFGIWLPEGGNSDEVLVESISVRGLYAGVIGNSAHLNAKSILANYCILGLGVTGNEQINVNDGHSSIVNRLLTQECVYHIGSYSPAAGAISIPATHLAQLLINLWDIEDWAGTYAGPWSKTKDHLLDANNQIYGEASFGRVVAQTGRVSGKLTVSGGTNFDRRDITLTETPIYGGSTPNEIAPLFRTEAGSGIVLKAEGEATQGAWDFIDEGKGGYLYHSVAGQNATDFALYGIGTDYGSTGGILVSVKAAGFGVSVGQAPGASGIGLTATSYSAKASPIRVNLYASSVPMVIQSLKGKGFPDGEVVEGELTKLKSATAAFTSGDTGQSLSQLVSTKTVPSVIQEGTTVTYVNATTVTLSKPALGPATGINFLLGGRAPSEKTVMLEVSTTTAKQWWLAVKLEGATADSFVITQDGIIQWGGGTALPELNLSRAAEAAMRVNATGALNPSLQVGSEGVKQFSGKGAPGTLTGQAKGDVYFRSDGAAGTRMYFATSTTAWEAIAGV